MRIEQLEYLIAISKYNSMKAASEMMFVSHQAISDAIRQLEQETNAQLVTRTNKGTQLTQAGWEIVHLAQAFLDDWSNLKTKLSTDALGSNEQILYTDQTCNIHHIAPIRSGFSVSNHGKQLHIVESSFETACQQLKEHPQAVAVFSIAPETLMQIPEGIHYSILSEYILCAIIHKQSALAKQKQLSFQELIGYPVLFYSDETVYDGVDVLEAYWQRYCPDVECIQPPAVSISVKERLLRSNAAVGIRYHNAKLLQADPFPNCSYIPMKEQEKHFLICLYTAEHYPAEILAWLNEYY